MSLHVGSAGPRVTRVDHSLVPLCHWTCRNVAVHSSSTRVFRGCLALPAPDLTRRLPTVDTEVVPCMARDRH